MRYYKLQGCPEYGVSKTGEIISYKYGKKKILSKGKDRYPKCNINGETKLIHILVATRFIKRPRNATEVNHKDGNKWNNSVSNLEWVTRRQNMYHAMDMGLHKNPRTPIIGTHVITKEKIFFKSQMDAARAGFDQAHISRCIKGARPTSQKYSWKYA